MTSKTQVSELNPLHQPINYNNQTYFTGQYFHQQYRLNAKDQGKYEKLYNFLKLIRATPTYRDYIESGDIVELTVDKTDSNLESVFRRTKGMPIMLINATAQVALTHHLDDEVSKQVSKAVNKKAASSIQAADSPDLEEKAARLLKLRYELATSLFEIPKYLALTDAVKHVEETMSVSFQQLLDSSPLTTDIKKEDQYLEPTEIGELYGLEAKIVNIKLRDSGYQINKAGRWYPTEIAKTWCVDNFWKVRNKTGYNLKWNISKIEHVFIND